MQIDDYQFPEEPLHPEWSEWSDEDLIALERSDSVLSGDVVDFMLERYKNLVRIKTRPYFLMGADRADLIQEGMIGLYKAISDFDPAKSASFRTFANLCVSRQILSAVKASMRQKHLPLNDYVSFDKSVYDDGDREISEGDLLPAMIQSPEEALIDRETVRSLTQALEERCSSFERKVLVLYLDGYDYHKIAKALDKTPKAIDNALQRIKKKVQQVLQEL